MFRPALLGIAFSQLLFASSCNICIDVGHDPVASGATSSTGSSEYLFNKRASIDLYYALKDRGIPAFFANPDEKKMGLKNRPRIAKKNNATLLVSMHHNSVAKRHLKKWTYQGKKRYCSDRINGYGLFISKKNPYYTHSKYLAELIGDNLLSSGYTPTTACKPKPDPYLKKAKKKKGTPRTILIDKKRGIKRYDNLVVIKYSKMPAILIENGVIINREEERKLGDTAYRGGIVSAIANGISEWCEQSYP